MPTPGYVFRDGQPIPDSELTDHAIDNQLPGQEVRTDTIQEQERARKEAEKPKGPPKTASHPDSEVPENAGQNTNKMHNIGDATGSHALARADHDEKGAAQLHHDSTEVKDLGWDKDPKHIPKPLVGGLANEDVWLLVRRFNKQMYHVKAMHEDPLNDLDLETAENDEFSPDKLRANVERLYMTVIVGLIGFVKHIARIRSWREPVRTSGFLVVYVIAWFFNLLMPTFVTTLIVLIAFPPARSIMFPHAPLALIDGKTGGIKSPKAGVLGSHDSVTGAPENHKGEAVEQEAHNFVTGIGTIALSSAAGKHDQSTPDHDSIDSKIPDPTAIATHSADAKNAAGGKTVSKHHDKTKEPMEDAMWGKMRPIMHTIGEIADGWERFGNALSPTRPFPQQTPRLKLAGLVAPLLLVSLVTTSAMFVKAVWAGVGFGFFGDPLIQRGIVLLNEKIPDWQKYLEIRNTILKGIPTNAQLTITLLRIGEANKAPLPPPPRSNAAPPNEAAELDKDVLTVDASHEEIHDAITPDPDSNKHTDEGSKNKSGSKVMGFFKGVTKGGVNTKLGADKLKATAGSLKAKDHLGVLPASRDRVEAGPIDFKARYHGKRGWAYVNTSATIPCVSFSIHESDGTGEQTDEELKPIFSIPINDIAELKKIGGFGWKTKFIVGWATDKNVADGLEIVDKLGKRWHLTAIIQRDELFNRIAAMGPQRWESW